MKTQNKQHHVALLVQHDSKLTTFAAIWNFTLLHFTLIFYLHLFLALCTENQQQQKYQSITIRMCVCDMKNKFTLTAADWRRLEKLLLNWILKYFYRNQISVWMAKRVCVSPVFDNEKKYKDLWCNILMFIHSFEISCANGSLSRPFSVKILIIKVRTIFIYFEKLRATQRLWYKNICVWHQFILIGCHIFYSHVTLTHELDIWLWDFPHENQFGWKIAQKITNNNKLQLLGDFLIPHTVDD